MNLFQDIAAPASLVLALNAGLQVARGTRPRWWHLASGAIWTAAGIAILRPSLTTDVARLLGIGRGADLLIYLIAILFIASFFYLLQRFRRVEQEITQLVRQLALRDASAPAPPTVPVRGPDAPPPPAGAGAS